MREASGNILIGHDARRALGNGSEKARDGKKNDRRHKKMHAGVYEGAGESKDVFAALDAPAGRIVDETDERGEEGFGVAGNDEYEHEEGRGQRGEQRRLPRKGDFAALDRIMEPLFCRLLSFVFRIDVAAHRSTAGAFRNRLQP